jgi:hypothetical protein
MKNQNDIIDEMKDILRSEGYDTDTIDELVKQNVTSDVARAGGQYHGPSNVAGLTAREYWETMEEWRDERDRYWDR